MATIASGERGIGVPSHEEDFGTGASAVREETGELDHYSIIDIIFHEDTVPNLRCPLRTGRVEGVKIGPLFIAARPWLGVTREF